MSASAGISRRSVLKTVAACGVLQAKSAFATSSAPTTQQISTAAGLRASVSSNGAYQVSTSDTGWTFAGSIGSAVQNLSVTVGNDGAGTWTQITFDHDSTRSSGIRLYDQIRVALFFTTYNAASPNSKSFPHFATFPKNLSTFSYAGMWDYSFGALNARSPWLFFDGQANSFIFSPASNFMTAVSQMASDGAAEAAIDSRITNLPAGFTHQSMIAFGTGISGAFDAFGQFLTGRSGKHRSANDSITMLSNLSYWTDAGAAYYYHPQDGSQYVPTLLAIPAQFAHAGIPIASMELDSWHYPKGSPASWTLNGSGMDTFQADGTLFPKDLAGFRQDLGISLITHARWIDANSALRTKYAMSGNVSIDPQYWQDYAAYLAASGVEVLEQDWLSDKAQTAFNLTDPYAFLDNMAAKMAAAGRKIVYCMPMWSHILQSTNYDNVLAVRVSPDAFGRPRWDALLLNSHIASAVGLWPFADELSSENVKDVLISTLTAGPLGSGDASGKMNAGNLSRAVRADGVIVKPDVAIVPLDSSYVALAQDKTAPMVASTYTDHAGHRTAYVFAYDRTSGATGSVAFTPESVGVSGPAYVYDYFGDQGSIVNARSQFTALVDYDASFFIVAPVGPSGMAFLGDKGKFVACGKKRIESVSDNGSLHVSVRFAPGETHVALHLYSPGRLLAHATAGSVIHVSRDGQDRHKIVVAPDATGLASLVIRPSQPSATPSA